MILRLRLALVAALTGLLHLLPTPAAFAAPAPLEGQVVVVRGNHMPGPRVLPQVPGAQAVVVAVSGLVAPLKTGQAFLPTAALKAPILARSRCNAQGRFRLTLPTPPHPGPAKQEPHRVTLLLVVPGGYWLNRFDSLGHFSSISLPITADQQPIVLRDDRGALH